MDVKILRYTNIVGPMHAARLRALARTPGVEVEAIEVTGDQAFHDWKFDRDQTGFAIHTLFEQPLAELTESQIIEASLAKLDELRPDVCIVGGYADRHFRAVATWAKRNAAKSILVTNSHVFTGKNRKWWREKLKRRMIRPLYDAVFVSGERARLYNRQLAFKDVPIVMGYNAVDNDFLQARSEEAAADRDAVRRRLELPEEFFLFVGRLCDVKNLHRTLKAYCQYRTRVDHPWDLVLVGSGPQEAELKSLAESLGAEGLHWAGWKSVPELPDYYTLAKAVVLLSTSETWGMTVNEGMCCGLPVVISELVGCAPELVLECENGFWCNPYDIADMANAMRRMSTVTNWQAMSDRSRTIIQSFTPALWAERLMYCIERASNGPQ